MNLESSNISCGIRNMYDLNYATSEENTRYLAEMLFSFRSSYRCKFILFSDLVPESAGQKLADYLSSIPDIGEVHLCDDGVNPNTGNHIGIWVFKVNWNNFREWYWDKVPDAKNDWEVLKARWIRDHPSNAWDERHFW